MLTSPGRSHLPWAFLEIESEQPKIHKLDIKELADIIR